MESNNTLKIVMLGDSGTGKTSIMEQYTHSKFTNKYKATIGADFVNVFTNVENKVFNIQLWDTAGQERFQSQGAAFYKNMDACILVYDCTSKKSFDNINSWYENFLIQIEEDEYPCALLGNKSDLETRIAYPRGFEGEWCEERGIETFYEVSAKDNTNISRCFTELIKNIMLRRDGEYIVKQPEVIQASIIDDTVEEYVFSCEIIELEKIMVSVFNTMTGYTYKTYIHKNEEWFTKNIHLFRGEFNRVFPLLNDSFINKNALLPYEVLSNKDNLHIKITYTDTLFPFELTLDIPKYVSKNGELDDRVNALEYQVKKLKEMIISMKSD